MQRQFDSIIKGLLPIPENTSSQAKVLLAVSGGVDSICMADLFLHSQVDFALAHCNFHLRGQESDTDEKFVEEWATVNNVPLHKIDFDTNAFATQNAVSIEMAARELRYRWFAKVAKENGYAAVAVAHNANDNAETLILNLLRGTGMQGLSGMNAKSDMPFSDDAIILLRPLLTFTRKQIEGYARANSLLWREDSTNADSLYKRNKLRNLVFPLFESINPSFVKTLNREMTYFAEDLKIVDSYCAAVASKVLYHPDTSPEVAIVEIDKLIENQVWKPVLYHIMEEYGFNSAMVSSVATLLERRENIGGRRFLSSTHELLSSQSSLIFRPLDSAGQGKMAKDALTIHSDGEYSFNGIDFSVCTSDFTEGMSFKTPEGVIILDADRLGFPFVVRSWQHGDWFCPLGLKGRKKLSDLFTDLKYSPLDKEKAVVIEAEDKKETGVVNRSRVAALLGVRIDDSFRLSSHSKRIIRISII